MTSPYSQRHASPRPCEVTIITVIVWTIFLLHLLRLLQFELRGWHTRPVLDYEVMAITQSLTFFGIIIYPWSLIWDDWHVHSRLSSLHSVSLIFVTLFGLFALCMPVINGVELYGFWNQQTKWVFIVGKQKQRKRMARYEVDKTVEEAIENDGKMKMTWKALEECDRVELLVET
jgi:hypothetical protein